MNFNAVKDLYDLGLACGSTGWTYDPHSGWLLIRLEGTGEPHARIRLGEPVAPLHPYFTKASVR